MEWSSLLARLVCGSKSGCQSGTPNTLHSIIKLNQGIYLLIHNDNDEGTTVMSNAKVLEGYYKDRDDADMLLQIRKRSRMS